MTTEPTTTHTVTYAHHRRAAGLSPLHAWQCSCGRTGPWTDRDRAREQGRIHERSNAA